MSHIKHVLVTGGAGFIGSFLVDSLVGAGYSVTSVDSLEPQVHRNKQPDYLNAKCNYIWGNCGDRKLIASALSGIDAVIHLAARVGVAQSMYQIEHYVQGNELATAVLLEEIVKLKNKPKKLVVASSMSIYGEGAYVNSTGAAIPVSPRSEAQLRDRKWELFDNDNGEILKPVPTPETKPLQPCSIYAIGKRSQEEMVHSIGRAYDIPSVACRFFNVYGSRQALSNPYTGVAAIFCSRYIKGVAPLVFEDGRQSRDFVHVTDIAAALRLCLEKEAANFKTFNVGSGEPITVIEIADLLSQALTDGKIIAQCSGEFRAGDIRHCFADISKIRKLLGFEPRCHFRTDIGELVDWVRHQQAVEDNFGAALSEAKQRGLIN
jgi:dTDP-L-rhamnose 4-epimerase